MTTVTSVTAIENTNRGDGTHYVVYCVALSTGDVVRDGPRFLPSGTDLAAYGAEVGERVLAGVIAQELAQWP